MVKFGNYYAKQEGNKITIIMPQTFTNPIDTATPISNRKDKLTDSQLALILAEIYNILEG